MMDVELEDDPILYLQVRHDAKKLDAITYCTSESENENHVWNRKPFCLWNVPNDTLVERGPEGVNPKMKRRNEHV